MGKKRAPAHRWAGWRLNVNALVTCSTRWALIVSCSLNSLTCSARIRSFTSGCSDLLKTSNASSPPVPLHSFSPSVSLQQARWSPGAPAHTAPPLRTQMCVLWEPAVPSIPHTHPDENWRQGDLIQVSAHASFVSRRLKAVFFIYIAQIYNKINHSVLYKMKNKSKIKKDPFRSSFKFNCSEFNFY